MNTHASATVTSHKALIQTIRAALRKPPRIVAAYLDASNLARVDGAGQSIPLAFPPAGGSNRGWWSNGVYLMYKDAVIGRRDNRTRTFATLPAFAPLFQDHPLVMGLEVTTVNALD